MLVGFAASSLMTLPEAMAVVLGADIGTTVTVQLDRLPPLRLRARHRGARLRAALLRTQAAGALRRRGHHGLRPALLRHEAHERRHPAAARIAALPRPSSSTSRRAPSPGWRWAPQRRCSCRDLAPTIGLLIAMATSGSMSMAAATPFVLGANIGTTLTPLIAAAGQPAVGKRVAFAHALFKLLGVAAFLPFIGAFTRLAERSGARPRPPDSRTPTRCSTSSPPSPSSPSSASGRRSSRATTPPTPATSASGRATSTRAPSRARRSPSAMPSASSCAWPTSWPTW